MDLAMYDVTLREGAQGAGASFSVADKMKIVAMLDNLGVSFIEAGNPASNPKDKEFFEKVKNYNFKNAKLVSFGSTARKGIKPADDGGVQALLKADTEYVAVFGKSWDFHATQILKVTLEENLKIIKDTIEYLVSKNKKVFFDAEHFFDGYKNNKDYAIQALRTAKDAGAYNLVLCDTNGGCFPHEVSVIAKDVIDNFGDCVSIHCHNDTGMAEANTIAAVMCGVKCVQATIGGVGERCGNCNLCTVIPNLQLKLGYNCISEGSLQGITKFSHKFSEIANIRVDRKTPYIGKNAFTHKAGMHIDGVNKDPHSFEHVSPDKVGQSRQFILSEVAGRVAIIDKAKSILPDISKSSPLAGEILEKLKELENEGYVYEDAEASFELVIKKIAGLYKERFRVNEFKAITDKPKHDGSCPAYAMAEVQVGDEIEINAAKGNGPVNALDMAIRKALEAFYPCLKKVVLSDYKVRVLDSRLASASRVRVLIESHDDKSSWTTLGVSDDVITASYIALMDSIEYKLDKENK